MARTFYGNLYLDCNEMSEKYGDSPQSWRRQARLKRVPAVSYRRKYFFNPDEVFRVAVKSNTFTGESINAEQQGAESDYMSDFM